MKKVTFEKPMTSAQRMSWAVKNRNVPSGIPVPVRVQRDGTNIVVHPPKRDTEGSYRQE